MDFRAVLEKLLNAFHTHNIRYALMGGFAMGLWGGSRSTVDLDVIHAFREAGLQMLERAETKEIFGGSLKIRTLVPEDIIGLKLQGIANDPSRERTDLADIEMLVAIRKGSLNKELLKEYFSIFAMEDLYKKLLEEERG